MSSQTITFLTGHYYNSARRAGFHNLADAAHRAGFKVNFVTVGYSLLSYLRQDYRTKIPGIKHNLNCAVEIRPGFTSYVHFTPWHPMTMLVPLLNKLSSPFMEKYGEMSMGELLPIVQSTDIFVFESMAGLFLFKSFKRENPSAKMIYRVSDDVRILGSTHPRLVDLELEIAPQFDSVSVPYQSFLPKFTGVAGLRLDHHGLDKKVFDNCQASPYSGGKNVVFVGAAYFDDVFIQQAARGNREVNFHIVGPVKKKVRSGNIKYYGELPFKKTIPYLKFADCGLLALKYRHEASACFTDSLKTIQYRYCGLPIVSPDFIDLNRDGVYYYHPGDEESSVQAVRGALLAGHNPAYAEEVRSWDEVLQDILMATTSSANFK